MNFPNVRNRLRYASCTQAASGDLAIRMWSPYTDVFERLLPDIYNKSIKWRPTETAGLSYTYLKRWTPEDLAAVEAFILEFQRFMLIGKSEYLVGFRDELDVCLALDQHYMAYKQRSEAGELEYQAKYASDMEVREQSRERLAGLLSDALPCISRFAQSERSLAYVPSFNKPYDVARRLAEDLSARHNLPLLRLSLTRRKDSAKDSTLEQKIELWRIMIAENAIQIDEGDIQGRTVILVDDLYQSGVTLWSTARFLKARGAAQVLGLVCSKTSRDTDNTSEESSWDDL